MRSLIHTVTQYTVAFLCFVPVMIVMLPEGENVCTRKETYTTSVNTSHLETYTVTGRKFCSKIVCEERQTKTRINYRIEKILKYKPVNYCCEGYIETQDPGQRRCVPKCAKACVHGECVAPNSCICNPGYIGPTCDTRCPPGRYGSQCESPCPIGSYGQDCLEMCKCENDNPCDHVSGKCSCNPGWMGPLCEEKCPVGKYGKECKTECSCQNNGTCHVISGVCRCTAGWTGTVCANRCPAESWGTNCARSCNCSHGENCHHITGACDCDPGYFGKRCEDKCSSGTYGKDCAENCTCENQAQCSHVDGQCTCAKGWHGTKCNIRVCPENSWGDNGNCDSCTCVPGRTEMCDAGTGVCRCRAGYTGQNCSETCPYGWYGHNCVKKCQCKHGDCRSDDGICHHCLPGYTGQFCADLCPPGEWGQKCAFKCDCDNFATCDRESGICICPDGWRGERCDRPCGRGTHGPNCGRHCNCPSHSVCLPQDGTCICEVGYAMSEGRCERCPKDRYGRNCEHECSCRAGGTTPQGCDPINGTCACGPGFKGVRCSMTPHNDDYGCDCNGHGQCDPGTGECDCEPGWDAASRCAKPCDGDRFGLDCRQTFYKLHGMTVSETTRCDRVTGICDGYKDRFSLEACNEGTWGRDCNSTCDCNNFNCNHETGECHCLAGRTGNSCEFQCPDGMFGLGCKQHCRCYNGAACSAANGLCLCKPGWEGPFCNKPCDKGLYGDKCNLICNCGGGPQQCDHVTGCLIREELITESTTGIAISATTENATGSRIVVLYIMVAIVVGFCILVFIRYYRKNKRVRFDNRISECNKGGSERSDGDNQDGYLIPRRRVQPIYEEIPFRDTYSELTRSGPNSPTLPCYELLNLNSGSDYRPQRQPIQPPTDSMP